MNIEIRDEREEGRYTAYLDGVRLGHATWVKVHDTVVLPHVEVDRACREVIAEAGWADRFVHGTGHGVGLDIHEAPWVGTTSSDTLAPGHVVTVEPGVYLPGVAGVRIEDTVVVTGTGCYPLTHTVKDLAR